MEFANFIFKFKNSMLTLSFNNYFADFNKIHKRNTRQKSVAGYYHHPFNNECEKKRLHHACLKERESIPFAQKSALSLNFKITPKELGLCRSITLKMLFKFFFNCLFLFFLGVVKVCAKSDR